jgi:hypothetical protein
MSLSLVTDWYVLSLREHADVLVRAHLEHVPPGVPPVIVRAEYGANDTFNDVTVCGCALFCCSFACGMEAPSVLVWWLGFFAEVVSAGGCSRVRY